MGIFWCQRIDSGSLFQNPQKIPLFATLKPTADPGDHFKATTSVLVTISNPKIYCLQRSSI
jgi:hypothetical protein